MKNKILLANDLSGYGKISMSAMMSVFSQMGYELSYLPTALVSNTLDYGKFEILDTTEYMKNTINVWDQLGFSFDCICTGLFFNGEQAKVLTDYISRNQKDGLFCVVDPVMGDNGSLYNGVEMVTVDYMKHLCNYADVITPNFTEAQYLVGAQEISDRLPLSETDLIISKLKKITNGNIVITGCCGDNKNFVCGYDKQKDKNFVIDYVNEDLWFSGTGDIFAALVTGHMLRNDDFTLSVKKSVEILCEMLKECYTETDKYKGIPIENFKDIINCK